MPLQLKFWKFKLNEFSMDISQIIRKRKASLKVYDSGKVGKFKLARPDWGRGGTFPPSKEKIDVISGVIYLFSIFSQLKENEQNCKHLEKF